MLKLVMVGDEAVDDNAVASKSVFVSRWTHRLLVAPEHRETWTPCSLRTFPRTLKHDAATALFAIVLL